MNRGLVPSELPSIDHSPIFEESDYCINLFPDIFDFTKFIIEPKSYADTIKEPDQSIEYSLIGNLIIKVVDMANKDRIPGVDNKGRLVIFNGKKIPYSQTNIHHIFFQSKIKAETFEEYPLLNIISDILEEQDPVTSQSIIQIKDSAINLMRLLKQFHMRIHGGRRKVERIKTVLGNKDTTELIFAFSVLNLMDRSNEIRSSLIQHKIRNGNDPFIKRIFWQLDMAEKIGARIAQRRPDLYYLWHHYIFEKSENKYDMEQ